MISIKDLNKAKVLAALYNASHAQGMGFLNASPEPMTAEQAATILERQSYFDYLQGRVIKVDLSGDEFDEWDYDRDNAPGAAQRVVDIVRKGESADSEMIERSHLEGTRKAAEVVRSKLNDHMTIDRSDPHVLKAEMGFGDVADLLKPKIDEILGDDTTD